MCGFWWVLGMVVGSIVLSEVLTSKPNLQRMPRKRVRTGMYSQYEEPSEDYAGEKIDEENPYKGAGS